MDNFGILGHVDDLQQAASLSDTYSQIHTLLDLLQSVLDAGYSSSYFYVHDEHQKIRSRLINLENGVFEQLSLTSLSSQMDHNAQHHVSSIVDYQSPTLHPQTFNDSIFDLDPLQSVPHLPWTPRSSSSEESLWGSSATASVRRPSTAATTISQTSPCASVFPSKCPRRSKLMRKIADIGSPATVAFAFEYTQSLDTTLFTNILQFNPVQYDALLYRPSKMDNTTHGFFSIQDTAFLRVIPNLGRAIEANSMAEQHYRIARRIALAHLFRVYQLAQSNSEPFLAWCKDHVVMPVSPRGNPKAMVSQCFAHLLVPSLKHRCNDSHRSKLDKVQSWRKIGKPWAKLIDAFGYAILLLMPDTLTDEDLRVLRESEVEVIIQTIKDRQDDLRPILDTLNESLDVYLAVQEQIQPPSNMT